MAFSEPFKVNVNKLSVEEEPKSLLEITHPLITTTVRLINDNCDLISNGENYIAIQYELERHSDVENELPKARLKIQNVGRELVRWLEESYGAKDAKIRAKIVRRSEPDQIEEQVDFVVSRSVISYNEVTFDLNVVTNNLTKRGTRFLFTTVKAPGLL